MICGIFNIVLKRATDILNFETLLHNFTFISTISPNYRTTRPVVTENSSGQTLSGKRKKKKKKKNNNNNNKKKLCSGDLISEYDQEIPLSLSNLLHYEEETHAPNAIERTITISYYPVFENVITSLDPDQA